MIPQALHIVLNFQGYFFSELGIADIIEGAGKHQVLPDKQSQAVAIVIEILIGVYASPPHPDAVEVGPGAALQKTGCFFGARFCCYTHPGG